MLLSFSHSDVWFIKVIACAYRYGSRHRIIVFAVVIEYASKPNVSKLNGVRKGKKNNKKICSVWFGAVCKFRNGWTRFFRCLSRHFALKRKQRKNLNNKKESARYNLLCTTRRYLVTTRVRCIPLPKRRIVWCTRWTCGVDTQVRGNRGGRSKNLKCS